MERNWLIRTTQNQILGPITKAKLLEFLQKGALSLNDEVTSANGYWFSLKEKELVEKYLYGDLPQGYNPISESKSVLSKRDNPDKTTSLNASPANKTQILKASAGEPVVIPTSADLEYPDVDFIVSTNISSSSSSPQNSNEELKTPNLDDLEFPDITVIGFINSKLAVKNQVEPVVYPTNDDLDYPDLDIVSSLDSKASNSQRSELKPNSVPVHEQKKTITNSFGDEFELNISLDASAQPVVIPEAVSSLKSTKFKNNSNASDSRKTIPNEERKLLHERKIKSSNISHHAQERRESVEDADEAVSRPSSEKFKKRNDNYLLYVLVILVLFIICLFFYYYKNILNKPLPV